MPVEHRVDGGQYFSARTVQSQNGLFELRRDPHRRSGRSLGGEYLENSALDVHALSLLSNFLISGPPNLGEPSSSRCKYPNADARICRHISQSTYAPAQPRSLCD